MADLKTACTHSDLRSAAFKALNNLEAPAVQHTLHQFIFDHQVHLLRHLTMHPVTIVVQGYTIDLFGQINQLFFNECLIVIK